MAKSLWAAYTMYTVSGFRIEFDLIMLRWKNIDLEESMIVYFNNSIDFLIRK